MFSCPAVVWIAYQRYSMPVTAPARRRRRPGSAAAPSPAGRSRCRGRSTAITIIRVALISSGGWARSPSSSRTARRPGTHGSARSGPAHRPAACWTASMPTSTLCAPCARRMVGSTSAARPAPGASACSCLEEVAVLALRALENDLVAHLSSILRSCDPAVRPELATGIEPMTSSLPRMCSTN